MQNSNGDLPANRRGNLFITCIFWWRPHMMRVRIFRCQLGNKALDLPLQWLPLILEPWLIVAGRQHVLHS